MSRTNKKMRFWSFPIKGQGQIRMGSRKSITHNLEKQMLMSNSNGVRSRMWNRGRWRFRVLRQESFLEKSCTRITMFTFLVQYEEIWWRFFNIFKKLNNRTISDCAKSPTLYPLPYRQLLNCQKYFCHLFYHQFRFVSFFFSSSSSLSFVGRHVKTWGQCIIHEGLHIPQTEIDAFVHELEIRPLHLNKLNNFPKPIKTALNFLIP